MTATVEAPNDYGYDWTPILGFKATADEEFTITRPEFISVIERVLDTMGAHLRAYEREDLLKLAHTASAVGFGSWDQDLGCPLQQTGLCLTGKRLDSVYELFVEHYDAEMRRVWGLDDRTAGVAVIL